MAFFKPSLRNRIFYSMLAVTLLASVLIAAVTIYQYKEESKEYHEDRLSRKENAIQEDITYVLRNTSFPVETSKLKYIFREEIYRIAEVHGMPLNIHDLEGDALIKSRGALFPDSGPDVVEPSILEELKLSPGRRVVRSTNVNGEKFLSSYTYITDNRFKKIGILNLPYLENDDFLTRELNEFLVRLAQVYLLMFLVTMGLAYLLSNYVTRSLKTIGDRLQRTKLGQRNEKIAVSNTSQEITALVNDYNRMVDELEESAAKLALSEREAAWREMAKQVAHEIKNPLTPMKLSVQMFQRRFDPDDPEVNQKMADYTETLVQQIDTMSNIATAFSNFAGMPAQQNEMLDMVHVVQLALDIFNESHIDFIPEQDEIWAYIDRTQLIRIVTNLVKNAIQATENVEEPQVSVRLRESENSITLEVEDNGTGITEENQSRVFEPKFTTKDSGMGLGLAMVKKIIEAYQGTITLQSTESEGTTFTITLPALSQETST